MDRMRTLNVYSSSKNTNVPLFQIADFEGDRISFQELRDKIYLEQLPWK